MSKPRPFFHDRLVLLLLTVNAVLAIFAAITAVLPIMDSSGAFIGEYRSNLGLDAYRAGGALDMASVDLAPAPAGGAVHELRGDRPFGAWVASFGGYKASGVGRQNGIEAMDQYLQTKGVWCELSDDVQDPFVMRS